MEKIIYMIINILDYLSLSIMIIALIGLIYLIVVSEKNKKILFSDMLLTDKVVKIRYVLASLFMNLFLLGTILSLISFILYRIPTISDIIIRIIMTIFCLYFFKNYKWNIIKFVKTIKAWIENKNGGKNGKER